MPDWGELFADPARQGLKPNPDVLALIPEMQAAGCRRILDAGCGVGRHLLPLAQAGFRVWGVDADAKVLQILKARLAKLAAGTLPGLVRADLNRLPFAAGSFDLVVSINVINHGYAATFRDFCRELDLVIKVGGHLFVQVAPWEFGEQVRLPQTRELEHGTLVDLATPDGSLVHHFPTPEELREQFSHYRVRRWETVWTPIPFMDNRELPQLYFWGEKQK
ncbi:MAG TPA: class I SAM-dependent methyltransferase [Desulfobaccales bacterium]|nr:class I SAM-dependent methyltransferase [Desulfobaccales bacterium]